MEVNLITLKARRVRKARKHEEHTTQSMFLKWLRYQYPYVREVTASFPNAGKRSITYAMKLKAEGLMPGMPDIIMFFPRNGVPGMFIEFKSKTGSLKPNQRMMMAKLVNQGYCCVVCSSLEEAMMEATKYLELA